MPPIFFVVLRLSLRYARLPGFRTAWFGCSRAALVSTIWISRTLGREPDWPGTSSAMARPLCELVTPWPTTWQILPPSAHLTRFKALELERLQTLTWECSLSMRRGVLVRRACSIPTTIASPVCRAFFRLLGQILVTTRPPIPPPPTSSASVRRQEAEWQVRVRVLGLWVVFQALAPIPPAHPRLTFSVPFRICKRQKSSITVPRFTTNFS